MYTIEQVERHHSTDDATFHAIIAASCVDWEAAYAEQDTAELAGDAVRDMLIDLVQPDRLVDDGIFRHPVLEVRRGPLAVMGRNHRDGQVLMLGDQEKLLHHEVGMTGEKKLDATVSQHRHDVEKFGNRLQ